jgi:hypothetical protein
VTNPNGPAFPVQCVYDAKTGKVSSGDDGMSTRAYAAIHITAALYAGRYRNSTANHETAQNITDEAIGIADMLLNKLAKGGAA